MVVKRKSDAKDAAVDLEKKDSDISGESDEEGEEDMEEDMDENMEESGEDEGEEEGEEDIDEEASYHQSFDDDDEESGDVNDSDTDPYGSDDSDKKKKKSNKKKKGKKSGEIREVKPDAYLIRREATLLQLCLKSFKKRVIVFFNEKVQCHRMLILFKIYNLKAAEVHGNLTQ